MEEQRRDRRARAEADGERAVAELQLVRGEPPQRPSRVEPEHPAVRGRLGRPRLALDVEAEQIDLVTGEVELGSEADTAGEVDAAHRAEREVVREPASELLEVEAGTDRKPGLADLLDLVGKLGRAGGSPNVDELRWSNSNCAAWTL